MNALKKLQLVVILLSTSTFLVSGQGTGYIIYAGLNNTSFFSQILTDPNGGYVCLGENNVNTNQEIVKLDPYFSPVWSKSYASSEMFFTSHSMAILNDGSYVVFGLTSTNSGSIAVIKVSPSGTVMFQKEYSYGTSVFTTFSISAAAAPNDNGYIMGGGACVKNNFLVKCDPNGSVEWAREYNDFATPGVKTALAILPDDTGYTVASIIGGTNGTDIAVMRVAPTGVLHWYKVLERNGYSDNPQKLIRLANGNMVILSTDLTVNSSDVLIFLDPTCSTVSARQFVTLADTYIEDIVTDGQSGIVGAGRLYLGVGSERLLYLKISYSGNIVWQKTARGMNSTKVVHYQSLARTPGNLYAMAGGGVHTGQVIGVVDETGTGICVDSSLALMSTVPFPFTIVQKVISATSFLLSVSNVTFSPGTSPAAKNVICGTVAIPEQPFSPKAFSVVPNPADAFIEIHYPGITDGLNYEVRDINGRNIQCGALKRYIDVSKIPPSLYLIKVADGLHFSYAKFIKK